MEKKKNFLRSTLRRDKTKDLVVMFIESELMEKIHCDETVKLFT